jgi:hypothetical protein
MLTRIKYSLWELADLIDSFDKRIKKLEVALDIRNENVVPIYLTQEEWEKGHAEYDGKNWNWHLEE